MSKVLTEFKRYYGDVWIDLDQAMRVGGREFVDAFLNTQPNRLGEAFRQRLFLHTEGHPLFTVELLRDMQERGNLVRDEEDRWLEGPSLDWDTLPPRVEGVVEERIRRLEDLLIGQRDSLGPGQVGKAKVRRDSRVAGARCAGRPESPPLLEPGFEQRGGCRRVCPPAATTHSPSATAMVSPNSRA